MVEEFEGFSPCFSAAAVPAGVMNPSQKGVFPQQETVLINLTGGNRPKSNDLPKAHWLRRDGEDWKDRKTRMMNWLKLFGKRVKFNR